MERIKGFKTIAFNVIMTVLMGIALWVPEAELPDASAVQKALAAAEEALVGIWGIGNLALRAVTNSPIFKKV